jgi:crotonobetainyl-CoA:carnitine CoA-transferase CaiB-like acyl-CoA transferase
MTDPMTTPSHLPLAGVRIIECSMLGPAAITTNLADLGAEVIKIEPPAGDYIREMTWPIVEGTSLMHLHINRGKKSITIDLRNEAGKAVFLELIKDADAIVEAMRPGGLAKRGLGYEDLKKINPKLVWCTISGYGMTGPYQNLPSHGIAYDSWSGAIKPTVDDAGFLLIPEHASIGIHVGPMFGALGLLAGIIRARATGEGCQLEIAQSDASAAIEARPSSPTFGPNQKSPATSLTTTSAGRLEPPAWPVEFGTPCMKRRTGCCCLWPQSKSSGRTFAMASDEWTSTRSGLVVSTQIMREATASCRPS